METVSCVIAEGLSDVAGQINSKQGEAGETT
jgi:hypothetical protein